MTKEFLISGIKHIFIIAAIILGFLGCIELLNAAVTILFVLGVILLILGAYTITYLILKDVKNQKPKDEN